MASPAEPKLDLATAQLLIVGDRPSEQDILAQVLMGFGVPSIQRHADKERALSTIVSESFDLALVDASMEGGSGFELISEVRRLTDHAAKFLPIILVAGHVRRRDIFKARDCGASFLLTKPISPQVLFNRILWLARDQRQFVECPTYVGPDRRSKAFGPPMGMKGRRADDLSEHVGEPQEANMSQDAVDGFFGAKKVSL